MKLSSVVVAAVVATAFFSGRAHAGETVFTDEGWYRVEGSAPTPTAAPAAGEGQLEIQPVVRTPAPPPTAQVSMPPPTPPPTEETTAAGVPPCTEERGALARRILALHGLEVSRTELSDEELGTMPVTAVAQANGFTGTVAIDPDLNALQGNIPIPPSSANWDQEARERFMDLAACEANH